MFNPYYIIRIKNIRTKNKEVRIKNTERQKEEHRTSETEGKKKEYCSEPPSEDSELPDRTQNDNGGGGDPSTSVGMTTGNGWGGLRCLIKSEKN